MAAVQQRVTYQGDAHETGQQEEVVVQVAVVQVGGHPLVVCQSGAEQSEGEGWRVRVGVRVTGVG